MQKIVTLTMNPTIDKSTQVDTVASEIKLRCDEPQFEPGGGGINVSRVIKRLDGESTAIYTAGGLVGQRLQNLIAEEAISQLPVKISGLTRENVTVFEETTTLQYRFVMPGPELMMSEWQRCLGAVAAMQPTPSYIVSSGSLPPGAPLDFYSRVAAVANEIGARYILDASGESLRNGLNEPLYLLKVNMRELGQLAGDEIDSEEHQEQVAHDLVSSGKCQVIVVSLGAAGALLVTADGEERLRAPVVPIRSKVGAGDSMVAGMVHKLSEGWAVRDAVMYGIAAGSAAVMTDGTQLCHRDDVEALYRKITK